MARTQTLQSSHLPTCRFKSSWKCSTSNSSGFFNTFSQSGRFYSAVGGSKAAHHLLYRPASITISRASATTSADSASTRQNPVSSCRWTRPCEASVYSAKHDFFYTIKQSIFIWFNYNYITGMEKINFSGGEPFIHQKGRYVGQLVKYCKIQLGMASVSIVSNGSLITEDWFLRFG